MRKERNNKFIGQTGNSSKAKYKCPPLLCEMIEDVNRLPKSTSQMNKNQEIGYVENYNYSKSLIGLIEDFPLFVNSNQKTIQKAFNKYFSPLGFDAKLHIDYIVLEISEHISTGAYGELGLRDKQAATYIVNWYMAYEAKNGEDSLKDFVQFYRTLPQIQTEAKNLKRIIRYKSVAKSRESINLNKIEVEADLVMDGTTIRLVKSRFFEAIENVDTDRIRLCKICENIFWAARVDSKTCSKQCYNTFRQRQFREKNREELNDNRRANYAYKTAIKEKKGEKNNGTL